MKLFKRIALIFLALCLLGYAALEAVILLGGRDDADRDAPVMIVLGANVWPDGPSPALVRRLNKALDYWYTHPEVLIVVSGGQGPDEPVSEAQAMYDYLVKAGVSPEQVLREDQSTNTRENLLNSKAILADQGIDTEHTPVVVVSNAFHLARVRMLCHRYGLDADTLGTPMPDLKSALFSYNREVIALIKSFLFD